MAMLKSGGICTRLEEGKAETVAQSETRKEGEMSEPTGSLQAGDVEGGEVGRGNLEHHYYHYRR
jgi:hypothetical protein